MEAGRIAAGSGRDGANPVRLDPYSLPVRFEAADEVADERLRVVDLHRERVVLRRSVGGMRMALTMPVASYRGVAIRLTATLRAADSDRGCARTCRSGAVAAAVHGAGHRRHRRRMAGPAWRRRRRNAIARRRPSRLLRRRGGKLPALPIVRRGEREIIARN